MDIHKDCYSAIDLTRQDGPHRRETTKTPPERNIIARRTLASVVGSLNPGININTKGAFIVLTRLGERNDFQTDSCPACRDPPFRHIPHGLSLPRAGAVSLATRRFKAGQRTAQHQCWKPDRRGRNWGLD
jgi:hypothetical protein